MILHAGSRREGLPPASLCAAGVLLLGGGAVHLALTGEHFGEGTTQGILFLLDGLVLVGSALWLVLSGASLARTAAALAAVLTVAAYVASRTTGIPLFGRETWDQLGLWTTASELIAAVLIALPRRQSVLQSRRVRDDVCDRGEPEVIERWDLIIGSAVIGQHPLTSRAIRRRKTCPSSRLSRK